jgi:hypothetical protein
MRIKELPSVIKKARFLCRETGLLFLFLLFSSKTRFPPFGDNNDPHAQQQDRHGVYNRDKDDGFHSFPHAEKIPPWRLQCQDFSGFIQAVAGNLQIK